MALTNAQYLALINDIFADNTTQEITEADLRNFGVKTSELLFLGTGTGSLGLAYDAGRTYDITLDGEFLYAEHNDKLWKYIDAVPQSGITPVEGVSWTEVSKSAGSSIVEWVFEAVYAEGLIIVFFNNRLYKLLNAVRPYQTTNLPAELLAGDWLDLGDTAITGTQNNTTRFNALGKQEESSALQNDGTDITISGLLNALGGIVADSLLQDVLVSNNSNDYGINWLGGNGIKIGDLLAGDYVNDVTIENGNITTQTTDYWSLVGGYISVNQANDAVQLGMYDGVLYPEFEIRKQGNNNRYDFSFSGSENVVSISQTNDAFTTASSNKGVGVYNSKSASVPIGVNNSTITGGTTQVASESNTNHQQRAIIDEHAKFLTDPTLDLDWNTRSLSDKGYVDSEIAALNHSDLTLDDGTNPHGTTKANVGLGNVDNTSDANKPVSTAQDAKFLDQSGSKVSATAAGTDTYTTSLTPAIGVYASTQVFYLKFTNGNTGAATININALGAKAITKNGATALASGDINAGQIFALAYDGTQFQIVGKI